MKFQGEVDEYGLACGFGETSSRDGKMSYKGNFFNDTWEGIGKKTLRLVYETIFCRDARYTWYSL